MDYSLGTKRRERLATEIPPSSKVDVVSSKWFADGGKKAIGGD